MTVTYLLNASYILWVLLRVIKFVNLRANKFKIRKKNMTVIIAAPLIDCLGPSA